MTSSCAGALLAATLMTVSPAHAAGPLPPEVLAVSPNIGPASGGQTVTITGVNFTGTRAVSFGGAAAGFRVNSDVSLTAYTPAHSAGVVMVHVINGGLPISSSTLDGTYQYVPAPVVASVSPNVGTGGTVTIGGANFFGGTTGDNVSRIELDCVLGCNPCGCQRFTDAYNWTTLSDATISANIPCSGDLYGSVTYPTTWDLRVWTTNGGESAVLRPGDEYTFTTPPPIGC